MRGWRNPLSTAWRGDNLAACIKRNEDTIRKVGRAVCRPVHSANPHTNFIFDIASSTMRSSSQPCDQR
jgi:hypothetical protein